MVHKYNESWGGSIKILKDESTSALLLISFQQVKIRRKDYEHLFQRIICIKGYFKSCRSTFYVERTTNDLILNGWHILLHSKKSQIFVTWNSMHWNEMDFVTSLGNIFLYDVVKDGWLANCTYSFLLSDTRLVNDAGLRLKKL